MYLILLGVVFAFLQVGAIAFVFNRIGVPLHVLFTLLLLTLLDSFINTPPQIVYRLAKPMKGIGIVIPHPL